MSNLDYPRDMVGYGANPPNPQWPGGARLALSFVINYEEGGESCVLHGDDRSETLLAQAIGEAPVMAGRDIEAESIFEYGSRAGFWRLMRLFGKFNFPVTFYAVGMALERNPEAARAMVSLGHEIATHGYRWVEYQYVSQAREREDIRLTIEAQQRVTGTRPVGYYGGRMSANTRRLVVEEGGFLYDSDSYADDLPYWDYNFGRSHLVIPYSLECNDWQFEAAAGFSTGDALCSHLIDAFDYLYEEGAETPKMMSVGLHCRLSGRPAMSRALCRFLEHVEKHQHVWVCRRVDIAKHWAEHHPAG